MNIDESLKRFGLVPPDSALAEIRALLAKEAELERLGRSREREGDLAVLCCVQLFSRGLLEDVLRIWNAKQSGFDLGSSLDIQFLCGAGLEETKRYLASSTEPAAAAALRRLIGSEEAGMFDGFTPQGHVDYYRQYFGLVGND